MFCRIELKTEFAFTLTISYGRLYISDTVMDNKKSVVCNKTLVSYHCAFSTCSIDYFFLPFKTKKQRSFYKL